MKRMAHVKTPPKRILFVALSCLIFSIAGAQDQTIPIVNVSLDDVATIPSDSMFQRKGIAIEIFKTKSNKKYVFKIGSVLRVRCENQKGRSKMKRAELTDITGNEFTFEPMSKKFDIVTYTPSTLYYVEFVTPGTFFRGIIVNTLIVGAIVVVATIVVIVALLTGSSTPNFGGDLNWIPFDDFHRHIRLTSVKKEPKWGVRVVYAIP